MASLMMTRHLPIRFHFGRGADPLFGVIGDLRSLGRKAPLRMIVSDPLAAREMTNRQIKIKLGQNQALHLTERSLLKQ